jgi:serine/threonine protein kinase
MITKSIGKGSFGEIYQGIDMHSKKDVAIKMVRVVLHDKIIGT